MKNKLLKIFSNCILSKGYNRSLIIDIQRGEISIIPESMNEIIELFNSKKTIQTVFDMYSIEDKKTIEEYISFLLDNEFGFIVGEEEFDLFPEMNKNFELASHITNSIIEISENTLDFLPRILKDLEKFNCTDIQLITYKIISLEVFKNILTITNSYNFRSIELIIHYSDEVFKFIPNIDSHNFRITELFLHSTPKEIKLLSKQSFTINLINEPLTSFKSCGVINKKYFNVNKLKVLESLNHNSCLNKKISIDKEGNIKNCPSMPESFGNIKETTLEEALKKTSFKKFWNINKDLIATCKDCEYRNICTDCRAFIENPEDQYSKPLKCGYNPYTNIWEEWSANPLKQKAIEYYKMEEIIKN